MRGGSQRERMEADQLKEAEERPWLGKEKAGHLGLRQVF